MLTTSRWIKLPAIIGAGLIWLPLAFTLLTSVVGSVMSRRFLLDFLMPAELSPLIFLGGALVTLAAWRAQGPWRRFALWLLVMLACLVGSQGLAVLTGLADGKHPPAGWRLIAVLTVYAGYIISLLALAVTATRWARLISSKQ